MREPDQIDMMNERGEFVTDVSGYIYFQPKPNTGFYSAHNLKVISIELDKRNDAIDTLLYGKPTPRAPSQLDQAIAIVEYDIDEINGGLIETTDLNDRRILMAARVAQQVILSKLKALRESDDEW